MRHRVAGRSLGRNSNQRRSLFRGLLRSLILKEALVTSVAKAKAIKPQIDKLVSQAKGGNLAARRRALAVLPDKDAISKLFKELLPRLSSRSSGYTRIRRVGRRQGDNAQLARIEFVSQEAKDDQKK